MIWLAEAWACVCLMHDMSAHRTCSYIPRCHGRYLTHFSFVDVLRFVSADMCDDMCAACRYRPWSLITWYVLVLLIVMCDYFRSLSGLRYQCRAYHLCWLRCDFYTRTLPQMTQVTVMILATHFYIVAPGLHSLRLCKLFPVFYTPSCILSSLPRLISLLFQLDRWAPSLGSLHYVGAHACILHFCMRSLVAIHDFIS